MRKPTSVFATILGMINMGFLIGYWLFFYQNPQGYIFIPAVLLPLPTAGVLIAVSALENDEGRRGWAAVGVVLNLIPFFAYLKACIPLAVFLFGLVV